MGWTEGNYHFKQNFSCKPPIFLCALFRSHSSWEKALASLVGCAEGLGQLGLAWYLFKYDCLLFGSSWGNVPWKDGAKHSSHWDLALYVDKLAQSWIWACRSYRRMLKKQNKKTNPKTHKVKGLSEKVWFTDICNWFGKGEVGGA